MTAVEMDEWLQVPFFMLTLNLKSVFIVRVVVPLLFWEYLPNTGHNFGLLTLCTVL